MTVREFWVRYRIIIVAVAVLLGVSILQALLAKGKGGDGNRVFRFSLADISSVTVVNDKMQLTFVRNGQDWSAPAAPGVRISKQAVDSFLDDCRNLRYQKRFAASDPSSFGLGTTNLSIGLGIDGRNEALVAGGPTPSRKAFYAASRLAGSSILVLGQKDHGLFEKDLFYFRDKKIFTFSPDRTTGLTLTWRGERISLRKSSESGATGWTVYGRSFPGGRPAPAETVNNLLFDLEGLESREFVDGIAVNLGSYGFPSATSVAIDSRDGTRQSAEFGGVQGEGAFVRRGSDPAALLRVDYYFLTSLSNYTTLLTNRTPEGAPE